jgi:hypothetical protein
MGRTARAAAVVATLLLATAGAARPVAAQPQIPATFYGSASIDGQTPPPDTDIRALVDGLDCTQLSDTRRFTIEGGVGAYVVNVVHESQKAGCGAEGRTVTFTINGQPAGQQGTWRRGPQRLDINAGSGEPVPLPTPSPTPPVTRTSVAEPEGSPTLARPTGPVPTDDIEVTPSAIAAATSTAGVPGAGDPGDAGRGGDSSGLWVGLVLGLAVVAAGGGLAGYLLSRRRRSAGRG